MSFSFIQDPEQRAKAEATHKASMESITASIEAKVAEATTGLKTKNEELLNEKKKIADTLKNFENLDPTAAREALKFLEENEDARLIKDGKIEELLVKKTSTLKTQHEEEANRLKLELEKAKNEGVTYKSKFESKVIADALREEAILQGVVPEALSDVVLRGNSIFTLDDKTALEARDKDGKLVKTADDLVLTPQKWIESLKITSPHYWPGSKGAKAFSGDTDSTEYTVALANAAKKGDMVAYRALRDKKKKK
jgi:hypothetical protein